eukprot:362928-Chlamydomonas_euryale.AAC.4
MMQAGGTKESGGGPERGRKQTQKGKKEARRRQEADKKGQEGRHKSGQKMGADCGRKGIEYLTADVGSVLKLPTQCGHICSSHAVGNVSSVALHGVTFRVALRCDLQGILGFETEQLVSTDYVNDARSSIVDAACTQVGRAGVGCVGEEPCCHAVRVMLCGK